PGPSRPLDPHRLAAEAIVRASGKPERQAFVVIRGSEIVALLQAPGARSIIQILQDAAGRLRGSCGAELTAGVGPPIAELSEFRGSHDEARRALRHAGTTRPVVFGPQDVSLLDELTASAGATVAGLIPESTLVALEDPTLRSTLEAFAAANLSVAEAAKAL